MKMMTIISRIALGIVYTGFSLAFFFKLLPQQEAGPQATLFMTGLFATGYLIPIVKAVELAAGIAFLSGRFVPLASIMIFPITLNIALFHIALEPEGVIMGLVMLAANVFLFYTYRSHLNGLLVWK